MRGREGERERVTGEFCRRRRKKRKLIMGEEEEKRKRTKKKRKRIMPVLDIYKIDSHNKLFFFFFFFFFVLFLFVLFLFLFSSFKSIIPPEILNL